jgi:acyl-coenzyme A synthetase/AMP-(fatty) acid ligase/acyl carrier protein
MKTLQFASLGFDASCSEIFCTLLSGGSLVLPDNEELLSPEKFEDLINRDQIDVVTLPPSYQQTMKDVLQGIKILVSAGEALNKDLAGIIQSKGIRLINAYGPTENTVCATMTDNPVKENGIVVIGTPMVNVRAYILDKALRLMPAGVAGEICLSGAGLARGYWKRSDLTAEKFVSDPFEGSAGGRMYRTGDLGRWLPDGSIEYLGRLDEQVKIRGYRIELGEIESSVRQSGLVKQCVIVARADASGNKRLVGYVVVEEEFDQEPLLNYLRGHLPEYMVPGRWLVLESLPLTASGKVDKKALPEPDTGRPPGTVYEAPRNELESALVEIWQELLGMDRIGIRDSFFALGGHSLLGVQLISQLKKKLKTEVSIRIIFQFLSIAELAEYIEAIKANEEAGQNTVGYEVYEL